MKKIASWEQSQLSSPAKAVLSHSVIATTAVPTGSQALPAPASSKSLAWSCHRLTDQGVNVQNVVPSVVALHLRDHYCELLWSTENARADRWLLEQACLHETRFNADIPDRLSEWPGKTEIRKMCPDKMIGIANF